MPSCTRGRFYAHEEGKRWSRERQTLRETTRNLSATSKTSSVPSANRRISHPGNLPCSPAGLSVYIKRNKSDKALALTSPMHGQHSQVNKTLMWLVRRERLIKQDWQERNMQSRVKPCETWTALPRCQAKARTASMSPLNRINKSGLRQQHFICTYFLTVNDHDLNNWFQDWIIWHFQVSSLQWSLLDKHKDAIEFACCHIPCSLVSFVMILV